MRPGYDNIDGSCFNRNFTGTTQGYGTIPDIRTREGSVPCSLLPLHATATINSVNIPEVEPLADAGAEYSTADVYTESWPCERSSGLSVTRHSSLYRLCGHRGLQHLVSCWLPTADTHTAPVFTLTTAMDSDQNQTFYP